MTTGRTPALSWIADRRTGLSPVGYQGLRRTCLAWAATTANEVRAAELLSVEFLHWASGQAPYRRGTPGGLTAALRTKGQPPDNQWPYSQHTDETAADYTPPKEVVGPYYTAQARLIGTDSTALIDHLTAGHLPIAGLRITTAFLHAPGGVIHTSDKGTDGHAVTVVGVAEMLRSFGPLAAGERLICVRNSWGSGWGAAGYALITSTAWTACAVIALVLET